MSDDDQNNESLNSEEDADGSSGEDESEPKIVKGWFKLILIRTGEDLSLNFNPSRTKNR